MKILVFGGAGFIGSTLMKLLYSKGHSVACADNFLTGNKDNLISECLFFNVDICELSSFEKINFMPDVVVHLAFPASLCDRKARNQYENIASSGMLNVLEYTRGTCNRIIYGSSISVYGEFSDMPITEETKVNPILLYGANKYLGELYVRCYQQQFGMQYNILRISDTFGERDRRKNAVNNFIKSFLNGSQIIVNGDGEQLRTYTYVGDVANAIGLSVNSLKNNTYNVAAEKSISVNNLLEKLEFLLKVKKFVHFQPKRKDKRNYVFNSSKFKRDFGNFELTGIDEGLRRTIDYIKTIN